MRDNIMYYPSIFLMIVEALALGFLVWRWREEKREKKNEHLCKRKGFKNPT